MSSDNFDAVIIGGGHNGLVCAAYLAKAGLSVKVLEKRPVVGGAAVTEEFSPGFRNSTCSYTVGLLSPMVVADLGLFENGLKLVPRPMSNFLPTENGGCLRAYADHKRFSNEIGIQCRGDSNALKGYHSALEGVSKVIREQLYNTPPNLRGGLRELWKGWKASKQFLSLDIEVQNNLLEIFTVSASKFLSRWFQGESIKALLAFDGIVGHFVSPHHPGTAYVLLHHCLGEIMPQGSWGHAIGGMGAISDAIARSARKAGVLIETMSPVTRLLINDKKRAIGVELEGGKAIYGRVIVSNMNPKLLFDTLVEPSYVSLDFLNRINRYECVSGSFRMNVALGELPDFLCLPGKDTADHHGAGIVLAPTLDYQHQAFEDAKKIGWSKRPIVEIVIPSTLDPSLAPEGKHVASLFCQHFSPKLPDAKNWDMCREQAADSVINLITEFAPNFRSSIIGQQILSPLDLEREFSLLGGDIFHGSLTLNQIWSSRPLLGYSDYRMPLHGLYLCGAGAHPGGGVTGIPGRNAAKEILKDFSWWSKKK